MKTMDAIYKNLGFPYHYKQILTEPKPNKQKKFLLLCCGVIYGHAASVLCSL